jgi:DNA-damage-inducible protein J
MAQTTINVRIDTELKKEVEDLLNDFGMNLSTAINIYMKAVVRERKIPFEIIASDPFYNEKNITYLTRAIEQINQGKGSVHELIEVDDE